MIRSKKIITKEEAISKWEAKLKEVESGKDNITPFLSGLPKEYREKYVRHMIECCKNEVKTSFRVI